MKSYNTVPQDYNLPFDPVKQKMKLEQIYNDENTTPEQKLDLMAALIEEGDDSFFEVKIFQRSHRRRDVEEQGMLNL